MSVRAHSAARRLAEPERYSWRYVLVAALLTRRRTGQRRLRLGEMGRTSVFQNGQIRLEAAPFIDLDLRLSRVLHAHVRLLSPAERTGVMRFFGQCTPLEDQRRTRTAPSHT
jgi:hypothetical protein